MDRVIFAWRRVLCIHPYFDDDEMEWETWSALANRKKRRTTQYENLLNALPLNHRRLLVQPMVVMSTTPFDFFWRIVYVRWVVYNRFIRRACKSNRMHFNDEFICHDSSDGWPMEYNSLFFLMLWFLFIFSIEWRDFQIHTIFVLVGTKKKKPEMCTRRDWFTEKNSAEEFPSIWSEEGHWIRPHATELWGLYYQSFLKDLDLLLARIRYKHHL